MTWPNRRVQNNNQTIDNFNAAYFKAFDRTPSTHGIIFGSKDGRTFKVIPREKMNDPTLIEGYQKLSLNQILVQIEKHVKPTITELTDIKRVADGLEYMSKRKFEKAYNRDSILGAISSVFKLIISKFHSFLTGFGFTTSAQKALQMSKDLFAELNAENYVTSVQLVNRLQPSPAQIGEVCSSINQLGFEISQKLPRDKNICISPFGIMQILSLLMEGYTSENKMSVRLLQKLGNMSVASIHSVMKFIHEKLNVQNAMGAISSVNALIQQKPVKDNFKQFISTIYKAETFTTKANEDASVAVNKWADKQSKGLIPKLLDNPLGEIICVLLNALYFKGTWVKEFPVECTAEGPFHLADGKKVEIPFMSFGKSEELSYHSQDGIQMLALPYKSLNADIELQQVFFLHDNPKVRVNDILTPDKVAEFLHKKTAVKLNVQIPKMVLESKFRLEAILKAAGLPEKLPNIANEAVLDQILQAVKVQIDEKGTTAAAVTAAVMRESYSPPKAFHFNRPGVSMIIATLPGNNHLTLFRNEIIDPS